jgi:sugar O-acyltransferase (sialic acid O-acetyltransferase NeuD family)
MIIAGAGGFAKEVCEVLLQNNCQEQIAFYDDISKDLPEYLFQKYPVLKNISEAQAFIKIEGDAFVLGVGNSKVRCKMKELLIKAGGRMERVISPFARIGQLGNTIMEGCSIMTGAVITSEVFMSEGVLINLNCTIGHNVNIGRYSELSPGVHLSGQTTIGEFTSIGSGAVVIPKIIIGNNVVIAAGCVVTKDVPDNVMIAGVPAIIKKELL